jgi:DNA-directed RNA polymerase subunit RPC12/RpoP
MSTAETSKKKKLPPIIGYVHDLSKVQQGPKRKWFEMKLQTATRQLRAVCFSKDKYNIFAEKEKTITAAKISNYVSTMSLDGSEEEILINDMTVIQTPASSEYSFQYEDDTKGNAVTTLSVVSSQAESGAFVNVRGKITRGLTVETVGQNNARMMKCAITDHSGVLPITIWEDEIDTIQDGHVYKLHGVGVRYRDQTKYLTTTRKGRVIEEEDEDLKQLDDSTAVVLLLRPSDATMEVRSIRSVNVELFRSCVECSVKIPSGIQTKIIKCIRCSSRMRFMDCKVIVVAKINVIDPLGSTVSLTIFTEIIENFLGVEVGGLSTDQVAEQLLDARNIKISYNNQGVVTHIEHQ